MTQEYMKKWDVFISYASEDKQDVARPLAYLLDREGLRVWFDEFGLQVGDSLTETIARGLLQSRYGVAIISRAFMEKKWPRNELNALFSLEGLERGLILPVWHNVEISDVTKFNPLLADRYALDTREGLNNIARSIIRRVGKWEKAKDVGPINGRWIGESGRLLLRLENDNVLGDYDWYGEKWVGALKGIFADEVLRYEWSWTLDDNTGRGFFVDTIKYTRGGGMRCLSGGWWYNSDTIDENSAIQFWIDNLREGWLSHLPEDSLKIHPWNFVVEHRPGFAPFPPA
jgi:hypothetical protein